MKFPGHTRFYHLSLNDNPAGYRQEFVSQYIKYTQYKIYTKLAVLSLHFAHCPLFRRGLVPKGPALSESTTETDPLQLSSFLKTASKVSEYIHLPLKPKDKFLFAI